MITPENSGARATIRTLPASRIRLIANAALGRSDVLPFWFGESDQVTPEPVRAAAIEALSAGRTFYTHNLGEPALRDALADYLSTLHARPFERDSIIVTNSGISALMVTMQALLDPGQRVLIPAPTWPGLSEIPTILGAQVETVPLEPGPNGWTLNLEALLTALSADVRLLVLNSPNNPTGWVLDPAHRAPILERCRETGTWIICDDVYERLPIDSSTDCTPSFLPLISAEDRVISVNSFSKAWLMTGWRLGWIVAPRTIAADLGKLIEFNTSCAPAFVQAGALQALAEDPYQFKERRAALQARAGELLAGLKNFPGLLVPPPTGGMYVFLRIRGEQDSVATALRLIDEAGLGLAPGSAFGAAGEGWLRWCFASRPERLADGLDRFGRWLRHR
jgi:aspartate/methionine/tyrosine aminotransferase